MLWYIIAGIITILILIPLIKDTVNKYSEIEDWSLGIAIIIGIFLAAIFFSNLCSCDAEPKTYQVVEDSAVVYTIEKYDNSTNKVVLQSKNNYKFYGKTSNNAPVSLIKARQDASIIQYVDRGTSPKVTKYKIKRPWHQKVFGAIGINKYIYIFEIPENTIKDNIN